MQNNNDEYNKNLKITINAPKYQILALHRIKNTILEEYSRNISISEFLRDALTDFINSKFQEETLKEDIKSYLESKGMI